MGYSEMNSNVISAMTSSLQDKLFPPVDDLHAAIRFDNDTGSIWLEQQRMLLLHASALGSMRKELIESLGKSYARGVLTRMGWESAQSDAELAKRIRADREPMDIFSVGPQLHTIEGVVRVDPVRVDIDIDKGHFYGEFIWTNSFEAEDHIRLFGLSDEPVCWHLLGYASGYTSHFMGKPIFYKEVECIAKGDPHCRIIGKPLEEWEDAEDLKKLFASDPLVEKINNLQFEVQQLRTFAGIGLDPDNIVADSEQIQDTMFLLHKAAETDVTVLMLGETGVGKEVFSQALHRFGDRANGAFIAVNCAALPSELVEAELFGVEKGAFTGADKMRVGRFERADGGTLFLDELGELSEQAQAKLLRVLQTGEFERVGGTTPIKVDVRLVTATNVNLEEKVKQGEFRADLFYRLHVFPITIPPLRERMADLPGLVTKFIAKHNLKYGKKVNSLTDEAMQRFRRYHWPGNIRELENILERGVILTQNNCQIDSKHICLNMPEADSAAMVIDGNGGLRKCSDQSVMASLADAVAEGKMDFEKLEQELLSIALNKADGNVLGAARLLGMTGPQCRYRLKKLNLI